MVAGAAAEEDQDEREHEQQDQEDDSSSSSSSSSSSVGDPRCQLLDMFGRKTSKEVSASSKKPARSGGAAAAGVAGARNAGLRLAPKKPAARGRGSAAAAGAGARDAAPTSVTGPIGCDEGITNGPGGRRGVVDGTREAGTAAGGADGAAEAGGSRSADGGEQKPTLEWRVPAAVLQQQRQQDGAPDSGGSRQLRSAGGRAASMRALPRERGSGPAAAVATYTSTDAQTRTSSDRAGVVVVGSAAAAMSTDGTRLRGSRSRSRSASCDARRDPPAAPQSPDAQTAAGAAADPAGQVSVAPPVLTGEIMARGSGEGGGGGGGGGGDPLDVNRSVDGGRGRKGGEKEKAESDDVTPIPCMLLLDSTRGHRSQEMFRMVRK